MSVEDSEGVVEPNIEGFEFTLYEISERELGDGEEVTGSVRLRLYPFDEEEVRVGVMQDAGEISEEWYDLGSYGLNIGPMEAQNLLGAYSQRVDEQCPEDEQISFYQVLEDLFEEDTVEEILAKTVSDQSREPDYHLDEMDSGYLTSSLG